MEDMFHGGEEGPMVDEEEFDFGMFAKEARAEIGQWGSRAPKLFKEVATKLALPSSSSSVQDEGKVLDDKEADELRRLLVESKREANELKKKVEVLSASASEAKVQGEEMVERLQSQVRGAQRRASDLEHEVSVVREELRTALYEKEKTEKASSMESFDPGKIDVSSQSAVDELRKQCLSLGTALNNAVERARKAEQDVAIYKSRLLQREKDSQSVHSHENVSSTANEVLAVARTEDTENIIKLKAEIEALRHMVATARREGSVNAARCAKAKAEREAALGETLASNRRAQEAEQRLFDMIQAQKAATMREPVPNHTSLQVNKLEERAKAAKRQVYVLDLALDAANARAAATMASRDLELGALKSRLDFTNEQLTTCKQELDRRRGDKAFYFSGQLQEELRRLELVNDVLRRDHLKAEHVIHSDNRLSNCSYENTKDIPSNSSESSFDARARLEYTARALIRACEAARAGDQALDNKFTPIVREVLMFAPPKSVSAWFSTLQHNVVLADAWQAIMDLALEALLAARNDIDHRQQRAHTELAQAALKHEAGLADLAAQSAIAFDNLRKEMKTRLRALENEAEAQRLAFARQVKAARSAADEQLITERQRSAKLETRHLEIQADLQKLLDDARAETVRLKAAITALQAAAADATTEHARNCVLAILQEARVNGPTYSRLLPVLRTLLHQPHNVVVHNLDALIATRSGATFIEALLPSPPNLQHNHSSKKNESKRKKATSKQQGLPPHHSSTAVISIHPEFEEEVVPEFENSDYPAISDNEDKEEENFW